jgi:gluconolactonase
MNSAGGDGAGGVSGMGGSGGASGSSGAGADSGGSAGAGGSASAESVCPPGPYAANPLPADLTLTTLCPGNHTSEGIVWFADLGVAFFSNFDSGDVAGNFNGNIVRYTPGTGCETFVMDVGTNGLAIAPDGQLLAVSQQDARGVEVRSDDQTKH